MTSFGSARQLGAFKYLRDTPAPTNDTGLVEPQLILFSFIHFDPSFL